MRRDASVDDWTVHLVDTGVQTMTGGRLKRLAPLARPRDVHGHLRRRRLRRRPGRACWRSTRRHGKLATITAVRPPARFGGLVFEGDRIVEFTEKPQVGEGWINGGFFVLEPGVLDYISRRRDGLRGASRMERLAADGQLMAYRHERLLAVHGHPARSPAARRPLVER